VVGKADSRRIGEIIMDYSKEIITKANEKDNEIISVLQSGRNFCVEAGAGAGKTYSLNKVIDWLRDSRETIYKRQGKHVICITFTNAAVNVISSRLNNSEFIIPSTIHSFAWVAMKQFQYNIIKILLANKKIFQIENNNEIREVRYTLGIRKMLFDDILLLSHDDVLNLFSFMLDDEHYRNWFAKTYPLILIDEYQDTKGSIIDKFIKYFIDRDIGPQFGFFGDSWQTIYQMNKPCGEIVHDKIFRINKEINFRSSRQVVSVLNKIRPDLPQVPAKIETIGKTCVILCDDFTGLRQTEKNFKDELPVEEFKHRIQIVEDVIRNSALSKNESHKTLMLTNKLLAVYQNYDELLKILGTERFRDETDPVYQFFKLKVEPIRHALEKNDVCALMEVLGSNFPPINNIGDKQRWIALRNKLSDAEHRTAFEVIGYFMDMNDVIPIPGEVQKRFSLYQLYKCEQGDNESEKIKQYLSIKYIQFINAINYFEPTSMFSTEHGSKGEEYDNVLFVISKGWSYYQFDKYLPNKDVNNKSYIRNRNLFYVSCSRAKKNLYLMITYPIDNVFYNYLDGVFGKENILSYNDFIERNIFES